MQDVCPDVRACMCAYVCVCVSVTGTFKERDEPVGLEDVSDREQPQDKTRGQAKARQGRGVASDLRP